MEESRNDFNTRVQNSQVQKTKRPHLEEPEQPMPIKVKPYSHQVIGYNLACRILGIFEGGG